MSTAQHQKIAKYIEYADATIAALRAQVASNTAKTAADSAMHKKAAEDLIQLGLVDPNAKAQLVGRLADPSYVLDQLVKVSSELQNQRREAGSAAPRMGAPVDNGRAKQAGAVRGQRAPAQHDIDFVTKLGLSPEYA